MFLIIESIYMKVVNFSNPSKLLIFLIISFSFSASASASAKDVINGDTKITKPENYSESTCPSDDFDTFFKIFSNNIEAQQVYTNNLITITEIDTSTIPDVKYSINTIEKRKLDFPLVPREVERKKQMLNFFFPGKHSYSAALIGDNNGYHVRYIFIRSACWHLIGIENTST